MTKLSPEVNECPACGEDKFAGKLVCDACQRYSPVDVQMAGGWKQFLEQGGSFEEHKAQEARAGKARS